MEAAGGDHTYGQLDSEASACARRLAAAGVREGDRVATTLPPGLDLAVLLHAVPRLGAVLVPLNTRLSAAELGWQREDCAARLMVDEPLEGDGVDVDLRRELDPGAPHTVIYTSGTTSTPKAVELTAGNHHASALASAANLGTAADDRWLCVLPLFHVGGLAILIRSAIDAATAVVGDGFDAHRVAGTLSSGDVTLASLVPTMLVRLREAGLTAAPGLRALLVGGGPIPAELLDWARAAGLPVAPTYGMTETASQVATVAPAEALAGVRAARPLLGVELRIADDGEVLVRGPMVAPGAVSTDGWLHTGDLGALDRQGRLRVEGRLKDVIVTGGENVVAGEVEEALRSHPAVAEAGVAGLPDAEWGERVAAFVVLRGETTAPELIAHCAARLAPFKVPRRVEFREALPRNAAGKLLRGALVRDHAEERHG